ALSRPGPGWPGPHWAGPRARSELPTLVLMVIPTRTVFRVRRPLRISALFGATLLLDVGGLGGMGVARPALASPDPLLSDPTAIPPPATPTSEDPREPGASDLLGGEPLRLGLMPQGPLLPPANVAPSVEPPVEPPAKATPAPAPSRQLVLDRRRKVLRVFDGRKEVRRYPVAVGMPGWETPVGRFSVIEKRANPTWEHPASGQLLPPGPANPLGSRWIGFHRDCRGRSGFNGQEHLVVKGCVTAGFHGTPNRGSVGRAVSHGCVRLFDEHAKELFDLVSLGTPVTVLP
ncbi:MAG: L,D-transpeptidase, partial [Cyanobacteriota bacterium]|nr:L,D-transpeptidase [Cyanobacteriota bacterium]